MPPLRSGSPSSSSPRPLSKRAGIVERQTNPPTPGGITSGHHLRGQGSARRHPVRPLATANPRHHPLAQGVIGERLAIGQRKCPPTRPPVRLSPPPKRPRSTLNTSVPSVTGAGSACLTPAAAAGRHRAAGALSHQRIAGCVAFIQDQVLSPNQTGNLVVVALTLQRSWFRGRGRCVAGGPGRFHPGHGQFDALRRSRGRHQESAHLAVGGTADPAGHDRPGGILRGTG